MVIGPLIGKFSDRIGKYKLFVIGSILSVIMVNIYCNLAIPDPQDRGAFMSVNSSIMSLAGGVAAIIAGMIVVQKGDAPFENYDIIGYVVAGSAIITILLMYPIHRYILNNQAIVNKQPKDMPKEESVIPVNAE